ncbi:hypothetical protein VU01_10378 [Candidatus Electrothrix marina]|uniref:Uncharacterized protein n=1 Tax=Candidatus Electrothrix marina TaxID=1859130 RepID=A0A444J5Q8_9BACT|nr:hypothetical protein VT99_11022 [Candidatus Electrothrix marina]RWX52133.1 hypothetical protein VU01_10378 [Candidatus Electrothrix marina]
MKYQLISSGRLLVGSEEKESIARIQRITKLPEEQVRKSLLNGKPKKLLSSDDKEKVKKAALALRRAGLEVKVQVRQSPTVERVEGPGDISPNKEKSSIEKERIDMLPYSVAPPQKKSHPGRYLAGLLLFLIIMLFPTPL